MTDRSYLQSDMANCPVCQTPGAYVGVAPASVACCNSDCRWYDAEHAAIAKLTALTAQTPAQAASDNPFAYWYKGNRWP